MKGAAARPRSVIRSVAVSGFWDMGHLRCFGVTILESPASTNHSANNKSGRKAAHEKAKRGMERRAGDCARADAPKVGD